MKSRSPRRVLIEEPSRLFIYFWASVERWDHSPFLRTESSFYRRSKINKYKWRLLKTRRGRLDITLTLRGLLYNTGWLAEDDSMRHHYLARITPWDTLTRRGRLNEGDSTRVTRRGDDSKRTTRRGSHDEARWFDENTLSHNQNPRSSQGCLWGTSVLRNVLTSLFIQSFEMFSLLLMAFMANPLFLLL